MYFSLKDIGGAKDTVMSGFSCKKEINKNRKRKGWMCINTESSFNCTWSTGWLLQGHFDGMKMSCHGPLLPQYLWAVLHRTRLWAAEGCYRHEQHLPRCSWCLVVFHSVLVIAFLPLFRNKGYVIMLVKEVMSKLQINQSNNKENPNWAFEVSQKYTCCVSLWKEQKRLIK